MKKFIGSAGPIAAFAAILAATVTAAVMMAVRPVAAQAQPRVIMQTIGAASIGVTIRDVTSEDAAKAKMAQPAGVYVESVREGTAAAKAGLQAGDIVIEFDGERVRSASHFTRLVQESVPDRQVAAVVVRGTSKQMLNVIPEAVGTNFLSRNLFRPQDLQLQVPRNFNFDVEPNFLRRALPLSGNALGVSVTPLSEQLAAYFGVKDGVLVNDVTTSSPAASAGLRAGDVITAINGEQVSRAAEITRALRDNRNETVDISITRDRKSQTLKATVPTRTPPAGRSGRGGLPV